MALDMARRSRARVTWTGYPVWYWLLTGAGLGLATYSDVLPEWWSVGVSVVMAVMLVVVARAACRVRGICIGWHGPMTMHDGLLLYGPSAVLVLANAVIGKFVGWWPIVGAVVVCVVFAGTGLVLGARTSRS